VQQRYWRLRILIPQPHSTSVLLISSIALLIAPIFHITQVDQPHKASDAVTLRSTLQINPRNPDATWYPIPADHNLQTTESAIDTVTVHGWFCMYATYVTLYDRGVSVDRAAQVKFGGKTPKFGRVARIF
jgi:hypothetical protein